MLRGAHPLLGLRGLDDYTGFGQLQSLPSRQELVLGMDDISLSGVGFEEHSK